MTYWLTALRHSDQKLPREVRYGIGPNAGHCLDALGPKAEAPGGEARIGEENAAEVRVGDCCANKQVK